MYVEKFTGDKKIYISYCLQNSQGNFAEKTYRKPCKGLAVPTYGKRQV